jgi:hypothetical protein
MRAASSSGRALPMVMPILCSVSSRGQPMAVALDEVDLQLDGGRHLERHSAQLAVALDGVAVAEVEHTRPALFTGR